MGKLGQEENNDENHYSGKFQALQDVEDNEDDKDVADCDDKIDDEDMDINKIY